MATLCAGEEEGRVSEGEVLRTLEERGVVNQVMESLNLGSDGVRGDVIGGDGVRGDVIGGDGVRGDGVRGDVEPLPSTFLGDEGSPQRGELHLYLHVPFPIVILLPPPSPFSPPSLLSSLPPYLLSSLPPSLLPSLLSSLPLSLPPSLSKRLRPGSKILIVEIGP